MVFKCMMYDNSFSNQTHSIIVPSHRTATIRDFTATRKCKSSAANVKTMREKLPKNTNLNTVKLPRSYLDLCGHTRRSTRPLHANGVSIEIHGLGKDVHRNSCDALITLIWFFLCVFYVYCDCAKPLWRFLHEFTATINARQVFLSLILKTEDGHI